jgi:hypothetical protein
MQEHVLDVKPLKNKRIDIKQEKPTTATDNNKQQQQQQKPQRPKTSMTLYPYYYTRLKVIADKERRTMVSYLYEYLDLIFEKHSNLLEEKGLNPR